MSFDFSEVVSLHADLTAAPSRAVPFVRKAVEVTARNVKDDARALAAAQVGPRRSYPASMEYEMKASGDTIRAEIGPRRGGGGNLAPVFETGNPYSGRKPALEPALEHNMDDFLTGLQKAIADGALP